MANAKIFAICSKTTSVGRWITTNRLGVVVEPDVNSIVDGFVHLNTVGEKTGHPSKKFKKTLTLDYFITALRDEIIGLWR